MRLERDDIMAVTILNSSRRRPDCPAVQMGEEHGMFTVRLGQSLRVKALLPVNVHPDSHSCPSWCFLLRNLFMGPDCVSAKIPNFPLRLVCPDECMKKIELPPPHPSLSFCLKAEDGKRGMDEGMGGRETQDSRTGLLGYGVYFFARMSAVADISEAL